MSKLAHARLSLKEKIKSSELLELEEKPDPTFLQLDFGKDAEKNIRLPEVILTDPGYFYWGLNKEIFRDWLGFQAWEISQKAQHILPPRDRPTYWEFAMEFDKNNQFLDFQIVRKSQKLKPRPGLLRVKHLDISVVSMPGPKSQRACKIMAKRIREECFPDKKLGRWDYQEFFENNDNFDLLCRELHCPKIPRCAAPKRICPRYDGTDLE